MEKYKQIPNYSNYQVSDYGNVRRITKNGFYQLKLNSSNKYLRVNLSKNSVVKTYRVHVLVAMAFLGHKPCGHKLVIDHIDNNPLNNKLENLQLVSNAENCRKDKVSPCIYKNGDKWGVRIQQNNNRKWYGKFESKQSAIDFYKTIIA